MQSRIIKLASIPVVIAALGGAAFFAVSKNARGESSPQYKTSPIAKGNIEETVSSNGNLKAVGTVDVLTQVTGTLEKVFVDFNDHVTKNQPLAEINTDKLKITLKEAQAALDKARAQYEYDEGEYRKSATLKERSLISDSELASAKLSYATSKASLVQAEAAYEEARMNIEQYAVILSPIDGIVLDRAVDPGQTVVGSGSTNTQLFTLAENLKTMDIEAAVDELDISKVKLGQKTRFTVEAYSERKFEGVVRQIRVVPETSSNVVSYTVIVRADNADGALLPGMTATLEFIISEKKDVVLVPNAALRFTPSAEIQAAARRKLFEDRIKDRPEEERKAMLAQYDERAKSSSGNGSLLGGSMGGMPGGGFGGPPPGVGARPAGGAPGGAPGGVPGASNAAARTSSDARKQVWLLEDDGSVSMRIVTVGSSDGANTEILNADELVGKSIITKAQ